MPLAQSLLALSNQSLDSGRYRLLNLLGTGGYGAVYLALEHDASCSRVKARAIKVLPLAHRDLRRATYQMREITLRSRVGNPGDPHLDTEDQRLYEKQDLDLARGLRTRAEALEKVIVATLDGMPRVNPHENAEGDSLDGLGRPPESSESGKNEAAAGLSTSKAPSASSKDTKQTVKPAPPLPNGVRLRLALGTVINDLFARCPPPPPRRRRGSLPSGDASDGPSQDGAQEAPIVEEHTTRDEWPTPLRSLAKAAHIDDGMPPQEDPALTGIPDANRTRALYVPGADPATANSPAEMR